MANRVVFQERMDHLVASADPTPAAILFVDLDDFKMINDTLGHASGDRVLVEAARRLEECVRSADLVARLSGDEFAVVLASAPTEETTMAVAERIRDRLSAPFCVGEGEVRITASIGVSFHRPSATTTTTDPARQLLRAADVAMYQAKDRGKGGIQLFEEGMEVDAIKQLDLHNDIEHALERGELDVHASSPPGSAAHTGRRPRRPPRERAVGRGGVESGCRVGFGYFQGLSESRPK